MFFSCYDSEKRSHQSHQLRDRTIFTWFSVTLLQRHSVLEA
ncbi:hypothetical protein [uncultured Nostoc sp.]